MVFGDAFNQDNIPASEENPDRHVFYRALARHSTNALQTFESALREIPIERFILAPDDFRFDRCEVTSALVRSIERKHA